MVATSFTNTSMASLPLLRDHKPLESLFKKPLSKAAQRLQRMMLKVQHYDLTVNYTPGKEIRSVERVSPSHQLLRRSSKYL